MLLRADAAAAGPGFGRRNGRRDGHDGQLRRIGGAELVGCVHSSRGQRFGPQCVEGKGLLPAQVYYQPYRTGTTYISDGRGCAIVTAPPSSNCQSVGPLTATL